MFTVGSVPYINAIPLASWFDDLGERSPVRVIYDVPSRLPRLLENGEADAILVSSVDSLRVPNRRIAAGVCIGSHGPVKSVRLLSKVPPSEIKTLAEDASSMTSNRLARIILSERYGVTPVGETRPPDLQQMLDEFDACVLIGDIGMIADGTGLHVLDLGEEWRLLTGKPFVWAGWIGGERLTPELAGWLVAAATISQAGRNLPSAEGENVKDQTEVSKFISSLDLPLGDARQDLIRKAGGRGWTDEMIVDYFFNVMVYDMDDNVLAGLQEFQARLLGSGFEDCKHFPEIIAPLFH